MGLETVIVKQVVNVAKDTAKIQDSLSVMEEKLINETLKTVERSGINPQFLQFDVVALARGENDIGLEEILTPESICSTPSLTTAQKENTRKQVELLQNNISKLIDNTNKLKEALITVQRPLQTLEVTANTLNVIITSVKVGVKVIKAIPIPVAFGAPAIAIPLNVITILSDALDQLDKLLTMGKGVVSLIPKLISGIIGLISQAIIAMDKTLSMVQPSLAILAFLSAKIELGDSCPAVIGSPVTDISQLEIDVIEKTLNNEIRKDLLAAGDSSIPEINIANEEDLIKQLQANSRDPLIYKGFVMVIDYDPKNKFAFDSRRIISTRNFSISRGEKFFTSTDKFATPLTGNIVLYNDPQNKARYSFSSSVQVLVEEMKYNIDQYVAGLTIQITENDLNIVRGDGIGGIAGSTGVSITGLNYSGSSINNPTGSSSGIIADWTIIGNDPSNVDNILTPTTGNVSGTITTTIPNTKVVMSAFGGTGTQGSFTNAIFRLQLNGNPIARQKEVYAQELEIKESLPIFLQSTGIWDFEMIMVDSVGYGNQVGFVVSAI